MRNVHANKADTLPGDIVASFNEYPTHRVVAILNTRKTWASWYEACGRRPSKSVQAGIFSFQATARRVSISKAKFFDSLANRC